MSRDYKPSPDKSRTNRRKSNPFLAGLLIGFLLGIAASLSVVIFVKGGESPFSHQENGGSSIKSNNIADKIKNQSSTKPQPTEDEGSALPTDVDPTVTKEDDKARFDFYTILPGSESKVSKEEQKAIKSETPLAAVPKSYFLQVGAFQTAVEADNMKATLALQGFEAVVQTAAIPDKGVWHRVRVGPLKDLDQINKTKTDLIKDGFKADLIKVNNENQ